MTIRVAAIQVTSVDGAPQRNLDNATRHVADAAARGAELIIAPEFLSTGYLFDESLWRSGEPLGGRTESWLAALAREHGVLVGAGFLEADGDDFYNCFSLFGPSGLVGRVRKWSLPFFEGWFFKPSADSRVLDTPIGRIGVGICNDTQTASFLNEMSDERPDLIVMPHSAPTPQVPIIDRLFRPAYETQLRGTARRYAETLGIPIVMANKVSFDTRHTPVPILPGLRLPMRFRGHSSICDRDGAVLDELMDAEGALVADVQLAGPRPSDAPQSTGYWSFAPALFPRTMGALLRALERLGQRGYQRNRRRADAARRADAPPTSAKSGATSRQARRPT